MLITFGRTVFLYTLVFVIIRIMGKRQIGKLSPFELVVTIMLADLAIIPMEDKDIPLIDGIVPLLTILIAEVFLSFITLYSQKGRRLITGAPSILIRDGVVNEQECKHLRYNLNDLLEQIRAKNVPNISDIEFAILETNGELSIIPKSQKRPLNPADLSIDTSYEGLPLPLVVDGVINHENLKMANLDVPWLKEELAKFGFTDPQDLFFVSLDTGGKLFFQKKS